MSEEAEAAREPLEGEVLPAPWVTNTEYEGENLGGRPRKYDTPQQFDDSANAYFMWCNQNGEPYTITGLALGMGFASVKTLYNYATYEGFLQSVERARTIVEYGYERNLHGKHANGAKFALACIGQDDRWRPVKELGGDELGTHEDRLAHLR